MTLGVGYPHCTGWHWHLLMTLAVSSITGHNVHQRVHLNISVGDITLMRQLVVRCSSVICSHHGRCDVNDGRTYVCTSSYLYLWVNARQRVTHVLWWLIESVIDESVDLPVVTTAVCTSREKTPSLGTLSSEPGHVTPTPSSSQLHTFQKDCVRGENPATPRAQFSFPVAGGLSLIHIWRCRRSTLCRSRWSPYH